MCSLRVLYHISFPKMDHSHRTTCPERTISAFIEIEYTITK